LPGQGYADAGRRYAVKAKEKVLLLLEHDRDDADKTVKRWSDAVNRYDADLLFNQEKDLPVNMATVSSRNIAKEELANARETKRLYTIAINAVRKA
jgi:hypothetical protein